MGKHTCVVVCCVLMLGGCAPAICDYYAAYEVHGALIDSSGSTAIGNAQLEIALIRNGSLLGSDLSARTNYQGVFTTVIMVEWVGGLCDPENLPTAFLKEPPDSVVIRVLENGTSEEVSIPINEANLTIQSPDRGTVDLGEVQIELGNTDDR